MRERSTWDRNQIAKQAAMPKTADPYLMNQDHVKQQPPADKYVTGDPSTFAEDVHPSKDTWEAEYSGGAVKRNEIGLPEMRSDTFNHAEKTASEDVLVKKAQLCVRVARLMLPKTASAEAVEDQGLALMHLPDAELINTFNRLAQDEQQDQGQQAQGQQQKQGGEMPPQFKENAEKKKEEAEAKKDQQGQQKQANDQIAAAVACIQAGDMMGAKTAIQAAIQAAAQQMMGAKMATEMQQQAQQGQPMQQQAQGQQQMDQQAQMQQQSQMDQQAQMQQQAMQQQLAHMVQQAAQQAMMQQAQQQPMQMQANGQPQMQQQAQGQMPQQQQAGQAQFPGGQFPTAQGQMPQQQQAQGQMPQQQQAQGQPQQPTADDMLLDQMLMDMPPAAPAADMEVELEAPSMDVGDATLGPEDAQLMQLFANDEAQQAQQAQQAQEQQQGGQQQQKQAGIRTASTRTVGTRPTQGVSRVGGSGAPATGGERNLSSLWNSAPDVSGVFGLPKS